jgi:hypothetical protein
MVYNFYHHRDGGHSWLAVKRSLLVKLGIIDNITECSYQKGNTVYLEEDSDVGKLLDLLKPEEYFIKKTKFYNYSPIRKYDRFTK